MGWDDLSPHRRRQLAALGIVQVLLAVVAWVDLAIRPAARVRGPKWVWTLVIGVNFVGPLAYLGWGRTAAQDDPRDGEVRFTDQ